MIHILRVALAVVCLGLSCSPAIAQCLSVTYVQQISNESKVLISRDPYLFLGQPGLVEVHDVSNPASPARVASFPVNGEPTTLEINNDTLYVTTWNDTDTIGSIVIVNIAAPQSPQILAEITWNEVVNDAAASTNRLCLLNSSGEIRVLDVTAPAQPISGNTLTGRTFESIEIRQNVLYATFIDRNVSPFELFLRTISVADIVNTNVIANISLGQGSFAPQLDRLETTLAAVAADRLYLFDLTGSPGNPTLLSTTPGMRAGATPYLVNTGTSVLCHLLAPVFPIRVWDVTNLSSPSNLSQYGAAPTRVTPVGTSSFTFDQDVFVAYSLANPAAPAPIWFSDYGLPNRCQGLASSGTSLIFPEVFNPQADRLTLIDVADPLRPDFLSAIVLNAGTRLEKADSDMATLGFVTNDSGFRYYDVSLYDIQDPASPVALATNFEVENTSIFANVSFEIDSTRAAVSFVNRTLILDIANPAQPRIASIVPYDNSVYTRLDDGLLVIFFNDATPPYFDVYDVSDPDRPSLVSTITDANALDFDLDARILAILRDTREVAIHDLSIPNAPNLRSVIAAPPSMSSLSNVLLSGSLCFLCSSPGHAVYSLATPNAPVLLGEFEIPDSVYTLQRIGPNIWGTTLGGGLHLVSLPSIPVVTEHPQGRRACSGSTIVLTADAQSDTALSYRWRYNGANLSNGTLPGGTTVSGAFTRTLTLTNFNTADAGVFNLRFTNSCGSVLSENAIIAPGAAPWFLTVPGQREGCVLAPVSFTVSTNFPTATLIRWQAEVPFNSGNYVNLSDFTTSTYSVSGTQTPTFTFSPLPGGRLSTVLETRYRAVATSLCGSTTSTAGRLTLCAADFNCDLFLDLFDYLDFVDAFATNAPNADYNADGVIDFFDYLDFVDAFAIGC